MKQKCIFLIKWRKFKIIIPAIKKYKLKQGKKGIEVISNSGSCWSMILIKKILITLIKEFRKNCFLLGILTFYSKLQKSFQGQWPELQMSSQILYILSRSHFFIVVCGIFPYSLFYYIPLCFLLDGLFTFLFLIPLIAISKILIMWTFLLNLNLIVFGRKQEIY